MSERHTTTHFTMQVVLGCAAIALILSFDVFMVAVNCFNLALHDQPVEMDRTAQWTTAGCLALVFGTPALFPGYWLFDLIRTRTAEGYRRRHGFSLRHHHS
jgi:hypothetical protein